MISLKSYTAHSHQGPYLQLNEDCVDVDLVNNLYLIFDGFGGSNVGDRCVGMLRDNIKNFYTKIGGDPDATLPFFFSKKYLLEGNALINAIHYAHGLIKQDNAEKEMSQRGGASGIGASLSENIMTLVGVGNCKAYLYRKGELKTIVMPDNMELLSKDSFNRHFHTAPTSAFGLFDDLYFNVVEVRLAPGDVVLMSSDGVYGRVKDSEIKFVLDKPDLSNQQKISELCQISNERGNMDNQSLVLLHF